MGKNEVNSSKTNIKLNLEWVWRDNREGRWAKGNNFQRRFKKEPFESYNQGWMKEGAKRRIHPILGRAEAENYKLEHSRRARTYNMWWADIGTWPICKSKNIQIYSKMIQRWWMGISYLFITHD